MNTDKVKTIELAVELDTVSEDIANQIAASLVIILEEVLSLQRLEYTVSAERLKDS